METTKIEAYYSNEADITFIMRETSNENGPVSTEVVGFYFGEPDEESTQRFIGKLKAEFEL